MLDTLERDPNTRRMLYRQTLEKFLERVRTGRVCLGAHTSLMSPQAVELYGLAGLDFVILGTEVEPLDYGPMENLMRAANAAGIVPIIKLRRPDPDLVEDVMNFGGSLLITPHVTSADQLRKLVAATRFGRHGTRGECPVGRYTGYGVMPLIESRTLANQSSCIIPLIEDVEALDHLDEIFSVEGVDLVTIGPIDFSSSLQIDEAPGYRNQKVMDVVGLIADAARRNGKAVMVPMWITEECDTPEKTIRFQIEHFVARGVTVLYRPDLHVLSDYYRNLLALRSVTVREELDDESVDGLAADPLESKTALERHVPGMDHPVVK